MAAGILAFLQALPVLSKLLYELFGWLKEITKDDPAKWLVEVHDAVVEARTTKDPKKLQELIGRLRH